MRSNRACRSPAARSTLLFPSRAIGRPASPLVGVRSSSRLHVLSCFLLPWQATANGIWVSNIPSGRTGNAASCAEHAMYLAMACLRQVHAMSTSVKERRIGWPCGETLLDKTALVVGYGGIARELVPRCVGRLLDFIVMLILPKTDHPINFPCNLI